MNIKIAVVGTGYVGLVSGTGFAQMGHRVVCADVVKRKIEGLKKFHLPIYEPELEELVKKNVELGRLTFTDNVAQAIQDADVIFIAVGTPMADDGKADLSYVEEVAQTVGKNLNRYKVIVNKSTVPIGTGKHTHRIIASHAFPDAEFDVVSNPEFLREGSAVGDFLMPDRIVIGCSSERAQKMMACVYKPFADKGISIIYTNLETAETIKYASNSFLATKIAFINEMSRLCDATGADVKLVSQAMGLDHRISPYFLKPGPGFGGSCFPKDVNALVHIGTQHNIDLTLIKATLASNDKQKQYVVDKLMSLVDGDVQGKTIAVLGLAFKANTDDVRDSSSRFVIGELINKGAHVRAYDPEAMENMKQYFPDITYCDSLYDAVTDADVAVILTEWDQIKNMDIEKVGLLMKQPRLLDMRNIIDKNVLKQCFVKSASVEKVAEGQ